MKKILVFALALFCFLLPPSVWAQGTEQIQSYDTNIVIREDGAINVTEHIDYFFSSPRHGILRNIPVIKTNDSGKKYKMTLTDISVADEKGNGYSVSTSEEGDHEIIKVGDPDRTITGAHWYVINYSVAGALTYFPGHDELYWNAVGTQWPVPINEATTTVTLPQPIPRADFNSTCFVGAARAKGQDCAISYTDNSVTVKVNRQLAANEGATVVVGFPKGMVAVLEPKELVPFFTTPAGKVVLVLLGIGAFLWYIVAPFVVVRNWWKYGRDPRPAMGEARAWFSPPKTKGLRPLTPAETGTLVDETADTRDIYATLVDLARRGYMKIIETKKGVFDFEKQKDWKEDADVRSFESDLLAAIFEDDDRASLKDLDLHETFEKVKKAVYGSLVSEGLFPDDPQKIRTLYNVLTVFALFTFNPALFLVSVFFGSHMPRKTLFGAEQAAVARSLKNFLVSQDKKLAFQAKNQMMFEKLLPYAVAFGVEEIWASRFKDLSLAQPDWYVSSTSGQFNSVRFARSIGRAASVSFASSVASKSSSGFSSGFSGGGSSGGGGGGGSW